MSVLPRTLPASWYRSSPLYQLERRAVFLRAWYLLGPVTKFENGEHVKYEIAQVSLTACQRMKPDGKRYFAVTNDADVSKCISRGRIDN